jgi:hypothetical protein
VPPAGPTTIAMAIAAFLAVLPFAVIAVVNIVMAVKGWTPLTQLVENYMRRYPIFAAVLSGFVGALAGHVFWSFGDNPAEPPAPLSLLPWAVLVAVGAGLLGAVILAGIAYGLDLVFGQSTAEGERRA